MLHHLAARAFLMIGEGAHPSDAIAWVIRRIDRNLRGYYQTRVQLLLIDAIGLAAYVRLLFKNPIVYKEVSDASQP